MALSKPIKVILIVLSVIAFIALLPFILLILYVILIVLYAFVSTIMSISSSMFEPINENVAELDFDGRILNINNDGDLLVLEDDKRIVNYNLFTADKQTISLIDKGAAYPRCYDSEKIVFVSELIEGTEGEYRHGLGIHNLESQKTLLFEPKSRQWLRDFSEDCTELLNESSQILANGTLLDFCEEYSGLCYSSSSDHSDSSDFNRNKSYFLDTGEKVVFDNNIPAYINILLYSADEDLLFKESQYKNSSGSISRERWDQENNVFIISSKSRSEDTIFIFNPYEKTLERITFGETPWRDENSEASEITCFSCGCSCYQYADYFILNGSLHTHIYGDGYKRDYKGIYKMVEENNWIKIIDLDVDSRFLSYSPDYCLISWRGDNFIEFKNICE